MTSARQRAATAKPPARGTAVGSLARQLRSWTDSVLGLAGPALDLSVAAASQLITNPAQKKSLVQAGTLLKRAREAAGLSLAELGRAIDLDDPALLARAEQGKAALSFEIVLRLAAILGRKDPVSFVMKLTRHHAPGAWKTLEALGIGQLVLHSVRERELANIYRASDAARELTDAEFAAVLGFVKAAFDMALAFRARDDGPAGRSASARRTRSSPAGR